MKRTTIALTIAGFVAVLLNLAGGRTSRYEMVPQARAGVLGCSLETVRGSYGFYRVGTTPNGPLGAVGVVTYEGKGNSSFRQTIRSNGEETSDLFSDSPVDSMYSVNPDCTAQFLNPDGSSFGHAVVVEGGLEIDFISLSDHNTVTGVAKRIIPLP